MKKLILPCLLAGIMMIGTVSCSDKGKGNTRSREKTEDTNNESEDSANNGNEAATTNNVDEANAKIFAIDFAKKASINQIDSLKIVYPVLRMRSLLRLDM